MRLARLLGVNNVLSNIQAIASCVGLSAADKGLDVADLAKWSLPKYLLLI